MLYIKVADLQIGIHHEYDYLPKLCQGFITEEAPLDVAVNITSADVEREMNRSEEPYPPAYMEGLACYRKIAEYISERDGCLLHGVLMEMKGRGILICAHSGVGKSTHAGMWQRAFGEEQCQIINGDKPIVRKIEGKLYGYGTPWCGKEGIRQNRAVELTDILMIRRGAENKATTLVPKDALRRLMDQIYVPDHSVLARLNTLDMAEHILKNVRFYDLECTPTPEAAQVAFQAIFQQTT